MTYPEFMALTDSELRRRVESPTGYEHCPSSTTSRTIGTSCDAARPRSRTARLDRMTGNDIVVLLAVLFAIDASRLIIDFTD